MSERIYILFMLLFYFFGASGQSTLRGVVEDGHGDAVSYADVILYKEGTQDLVKVETTNEKGSFVMRGIPMGSYDLVVAFIGLEDYKMGGLKIDGETLDLGTITMGTSSIELETAVVKAKRTLVEVKPDRMVFNVEGTINSVGDNALGLLRKAPGVMVDNNDNISVLSRSGVLIYIDGKKLPLAGEDLAAYLQGLPAEEIDRMDIITNPGAKYEAQGNAGIIDIRLKRNKNFGFNGVVSTAISKGKYWRQNHSLSSNYRNRILSAFGTIGYNDGTRIHDMTWINKQNDLYLDEINNFRNKYGGLNFRLGSDFFVAKHHTLGFLVTGRQNPNDRITENIINIAKLSTPDTVDSVLVAGSTATGERNNTTYNINYVFDNKKQTLNIDLDYGKFGNDASYIQPNEYYSADRNTLLSGSTVSYDTPVNIDIYTAKLDFETGLAGGKLGAGSKVSKVVTHNTYLFYQGAGDDRQRDDYRSNIFEYDENVYAAYVSYNNKINKKWSYQGGLRVEATSSRGDLQAFVPELNEDPVQRDYVDFFPNIGVTFNQSRVKTWSLNLGRRINRPNYRNLNPFRIQQSELSFWKGNPFLDPEIVNNAELGLTLFYRFNFKLSYSKTLGQITRLISPDDDDPRASFISWDNLAERTTYGFNVSLPGNITGWWSVFATGSVGYINNQADYGDGAVVDVQALTYSFFQQHTFKLPKGITGEVSGYYSGPGIWGGVFEYGPTWALNLGVQKKFFGDKLNVKLSAKDIFFTSGWHGTSSFNGLNGEGTGSWDSRRIGISLSYNFGNSNVKTRKRKTGIEDESKRTGESGGRG